METESMDKIAEALKLLEEAAKQKKDELRTAMADKCTHLKDLIMENESTLVKSLAAAKEQALKATLHVKEVSVEKARDLGHEVDQRVRQSPWPYVGGTALVGLMFGYILGRNRK
jgi:ElaB/YqjD/DUF883 family membrane-anchored ribosome-binding protein